MRCWSRNQFVLLAALLLSGVLIVVGSGGGTGDVETDSQRVQRLRETFACPECDGQSVAESNAAVASNISRVISDEVAAGTSDKEIRDLLLNSWGQEILLNPASDGVAIWVWMIPIFVIVLVAALVFYQLRRRATEETGLGPKIVVVVFSILVAGGMAFGLSKFVGERNTGDALSGTIDATPAQRVGECQALANSGELSSAIRCIDDLLAQDPENSGLLANRGWFLALTVRLSDEITPDIKKELLDRSVTNLDDALELRPSNREALAWRAIVLADLGRDAASCADLAALYATDPPDLMVSLTQDLAGRC